jgi:hypothetical protein
MQQRLPLQAPDANPTAKVLLHLANSGEQIQQCLVHAGQPVWRHSQQASSVNTSSTHPSLQDRLQNSSKAPGSGDGQRPATAHAQQHTWCDTTNPDQPQRGLLEALSLVRRLLVQSRLQPGPASLLGYPAAVEAAQQLLPFAPLLQLAHRCDVGGNTAPEIAAGVLGDHAASESLLALLPPAQRAWLLADAAAALLMPVKGDRCGLCHSSSSSSSSKPICAAS